MKKHKILFIHPFFPYPLESGGHQALFNGILAVKDDYDIFLAYEAWEGEAYYKAEKDFLERIPNAHLLPFFHKVVKPSLKQKVVTKTKNLLKRVLGLKDNKPTNTVENICKYWISSISPLKKEWLDHINKICEYYHFDIIQVEMPWFVSQVLSLPRDTKNVYVHHELGFVKRELEVNEIKSSAYVETCKKFADMNEIALLNMYDMIVTLSSVDAKKLEEEGVVKPIRPSFSKVDTEADIAFNPSVSKRLTFVGPDINYPNVIGLEWFLDNCWPLLNKNNQNYTLDIIGKWNPVRMKEFLEKYENINFLGYIDNLYDSLKGSIMIVPITIGSGIRMKILEAASKGIPFVSTKVGAEGIPVINREHCFITDNVNEFVDDILKLQDSELQRFFVKNSYNLIKEKYSIQALRKNRIEIYNGFNFS